MLPEFEGKVKQPQAAGKSEPFRVSETKLASAEDCFSRIRFLGFIS